MVYDVRVVPGDVLDQRETLNERLPKQPFLGVASVTAPP